MPLLTHNNSFMTSGDSKAFTFTTICKIYGGKTISGGQERYILKTNQKLPFADTTTNTTITTTGTTSCRPSSMSIKGMNVRLVLILFSLLLLTGSLQLLLMTAVLLV